MSEYTSSIKYKVGIAGADESTAELEGMLASVSRGISLVSNLDYTFMAWERAARRFDMRSFLSVTLSTVRTIRLLITLIKQAELAQTAYNAVLAISRALEGPTGWAVLSVASAVAGGILYANVTRPRTSVSRRSRENEDLLREEYRGVVP